MPPNGSPAPAPAAVVAAILATPLPPLPAVFALVPTISTRILALFAGFLALFSPIFGRTATHARARLLPLLSTILARLLALLAPLLADLATIVSTSLGRSPTHPRPRLLALLATIFARLLALLSALLADLATIVSTRSTVDRGRASTNPRPRLSALLASLLPRVLPLLSTLLPVVPAFDADFPTHCRASLPALLPDVPPILSHAAARRRSASDVRARHRPYARPGRRLIAAVAARRVDAPNAGRDDVHLHPVPATEVARAVPGVVLVAPVRVVRVEDRLLVVGDHPDFVLDGHQLRRLGAHRDAGSGSVAPATAARHHERRGEEQAEQRGESREGASRVDHRDAPVVCGASGGDAHGGRAVARPDARGVLR